MCGPQVRFRERGGGETRRPYSTAKRPLPPAALTVHSRRTDYSWRNAAIGSIAAACRAG
jgi:hypothetical protein